VEVWHRAITAKTDRKKRELKRPPMQSKGWGDSDAGEVDDGDGGGEFSAPGGGEQEEDELDDDVDG
jgi:hypothetical protein